MSKQHRLLGYAGLIPFIALAVAEITNFADTRYWLISYAALVFSFLGGIVWFASMRSAQLHNALVSVSTMLWAWCWLILPGYDWLFLAGLSYIALFLYECLAVSKAYASGFLRLRGQLTIIASLALFSVHFWG